MKKSDNDMMFGLLFAILGFILIYIGYPYAVSLIIMGAVYVLISLFQKLKILLHNYGFKH